MDAGTILVYCTVAPLLYLLSDVLPPAPFPMYSTVLYMQTVCDCVGGGGGLNCTVGHILQEFYTLFLTRFRTYKIASPPQTKMTSKDDIKGLVSLKFLRPCPSLSHQQVVFLSQSSHVLPVELTDGRGWGDGVGEELNHTTARKPGPQ